MPATLFVGPAACGKTQHVLEIVRAQAQGLAAQPVICLPTPIQARSTRRRLADAGGALGVRVYGFDELDAALLATAPSLYVELADAVQYRLMRDVIESLARDGRLQHFAPILDKPGFIQQTRDLIAEFKGARVNPKALSNIWQADGKPARLRDLATIYVEWQSRLRAGDWADRAGVGWLAVEGLEQQRIEPPDAWSPIVFDGFDSFTQVQLALITALAARPHVHVIVTLTGDPQEGQEHPVRAAHRRFHATRRAVEAALGIQAEPIPNERPGATWQPALLHLRDTFMTPAGGAPAGGGGVECIETSSRALEVRAALRWLKERILRDGVRPHECALVARSMQPYRLVIDQTAAEFGLPVDIEDGLPLASNPAVATILQLLHLLLPGSDGLPALPRRPLLDLWRSPYVDLSPFGVQPGDADRLDAAARLGLVAGGLAEWRSALASLMQASPDQARRADFDEEEDAPATVGLRADDVRRLAGALDAFAACLQPAPSATVVAYVRWLEDIVGDDTDPDPDEAVLVPSVPPLISLNLMRGIQGPKTATYPTAPRDIAALRALKDVLRGLSWAEEVVGATMQPYATFVADLTAAVEALTFVAPPRAADAIFAGATVQTRGVPLRLLAVIGMAEGELPARIMEDPFLRDADRSALQAYFPGLKPSTDSAEAEFFLDTITRPSEALLLVRPRISDTGAAWEPSSFWQDIRARVTAPLETVALGHPVAPVRAASVGELLEALAVYPLADGDPVRNAVDQSLHDRVETRATLLRDRVRHAATLWDGNLAAYAAELHYPPDHVWSASALETYRSCPFQFFVHKRLRIEARAEPDDGPSLAQIGNLYHRILQQLYEPARAEGKKPVLDDLLKRLPDVAGTVLAAGPAAEGFRAPPSWRRKCEEIVENVRRSVIALDAVGGAPIGLEYVFGADHNFRIEPPAPPAEPGDAWPTEDGAPISIYMRGAVDRIDRLEDGGILIIDYKLGSSAYNSRAVVVKGKKLQLALYAVAARQLEGGTQSDNGFYFFVQKGEASPWSLADLGGVDKAVRMATNHAGAAVASIRSGNFVPNPSDGCPAHCAAAAFCWHFERKG